MHDAVFGPYGYVENFDASFKQHCEGAPAAARGEVHIANPTPAPALNINATTESGTVDTTTGVAVIAGSVTCSEPVQVTMTGSVVQVQDRYVLAEIGASVACTPGAPVPWTAEAVPYSERMFRAGPAEVFVSASAHDDTYDRTVTVESTTGITLS